MLNLSCLLQCKNAGLFLERGGRCCATVSGVVSIWEITAGVFPMDQFNNSKIHMDTGGIILEDVQAEQAHIQPQTHTHFVCRSVSGCNELHSKKCWVVLTHFFSVKYGQTQLLD